LVRRSTLITATLAACLVGGASAAWLHWTPGAARWLLLGAELAVVVIAVRHFRRRPLLAISVLSLMAVQVMPLTWLDLSAGALPVVLSGTLILGMAGLFFSAVARGRVEAGRTTASRTTERLTGLLFWISAAGLMVFCYVMPISPVVVSLSGGTYSDVVVAREMSFKLAGFNGPVTYAVFWMRMLVNPLGCALAVLIGTPSRRARWVLAWLTLTAVWSAVTLAKSPLFVGCFAAALALALRHRRLFGRWLGYAVCAVVGTVGILALYDLSRLSLPGQTLIRGVVGMWDRLFVTPGRITATYIDVFPAVLGFQHGGTSRALALVTGRTYLDASGAIYAVMNPAAWSPARHRAASSPMPGRTGAGRE